MMVILCTMCLVNLNLRRQIRVTLEKVLEVRQQCLHVVVVVAAAVVALVALVPSTLGIVDSRLVDVDRGVN